jgi:hypothetical protein
LRNEQAAVRRFSAQDLAARMMEIGHKLIDGRPLQAPGKWLPQLRKYREPAMPAGTQLDTIDAALCRTADAARCWQVDPSTYNDHRLTRLVEQTQDAIARAYPPTQTTLRLLQSITPEGLTLALIQCQDCRSPLIAISINADCWEPIWPRVVRGRG